MLESEGAAALRCPMLSILDAPDSAPVEAWLRDLAEQCLRIAVDQPLKCPTSVGPFKKDAGVQSQAMAGNLGDGAHLQPTGPNERQADILTARATQALASPISSEVGKVVEQTFGLDTFQLSPMLIDPTQQTARVNPSARLTIGKRISDRAYLTFSRSLNSAVNDQVIVLEFEASERLSWLLSRNQDDQTYSLEFRVRHAF